MTAVKQNPTTNTHVSMDALNMAYNSPEADCINNLLNNLETLSNEQPAVQARAAELVQNVRANRKRFGGIDSFLQEFGLTTQEGIALMCLSEALLRIPDSETADKLIKDKIGSAEWTKHVGQGGDLFVNASTWTLMLTGKVIGDFKDEANEGVSAILGGMVSKLGEPIVRRAMLHTMKILGKQFVMGRTIDEALKRAKPDEKKGYRYSYDMLGEGARTQKDADRYLKSYQDAIDDIGKNAQNRNLAHGTPADVPGISIKLSALHPRYSHSQKERCVPELTIVLKKLALQAAKYNIGLTVDAEEADRLEISLQIIENVFNDPELGSWNGFGLAVQAYQKRCPQVIEFLIKLCEKNQRRMMIRLVKGAYWDSEIKHAQELGTDEYPVFTRKAATDVSYLACATKLMARRDLFYPQFATHNAHSVACILHLADKSENTNGFEFQRLHGMGEPLYHQIVGHEVDKDRTPVRIYAPVGSHEDLLPYLVRRLLENGANSSFVNRIQDDRVSIDDMVADPIEYIAKLDHKPHPKIPLPSDMFGEERQNSYGFDFADSQISEEIQRKVLDYTKSKTWHAAPLIGGETSMGDPIPVLNPANLNEQAGDVIMASKADIQNALKATSASFNSWNKTPAKTRAECLNNMADLLEDNMAELMAICVKEAGKTLPDALSEIREAVDFCRYYAVQGIKNFTEPTTLPGPTGESNKLFLTGRGTILCISPWNFPLAIFIGQVTAALMAGNTVIAKPATQTPLIAMKAVELLIKAGIPANAIALLPVSGRLAGEDLVTHKNIAGIVFTGSTQTARTINKTLADRTGAIIPLIAETGGQNAMIVDNSALPEQVVDDIIISACQSAGQRCSALRVLFIQDDIAETVLTMLDGAMQELTFGNPVHLSTDIGPVIDKTALDGLEAHKKNMDKYATLKSTIKLPKSCKDGTFCAPAVYELENLSLLKEENFGPILHVIRYKTGDLDSVIDQINDTAFGLTLGIHTRIDYVRDKIIARTNVGNSYVNRSMIGAVVGVQPFGGQGLSGTGPKAGGPHYLLRLATEKTITINTTASGGNTTLVSLSENDD